MIIASISAFDNSGFYGASASYLELPSVANCSETTVFVDNLFVSSDSLLF